MPGSDAGGTCMIIVPSLVFTWTQPFFGSRLVISPSIECRPTMWSVPVDNPLPVDRCRSIVWDFGAGLSVYVDCADAAPAPIPQSDGTTTPATRARVELMLNSLPWSFASAGRA